MRTISVQDLAGRIQDSPCKLVDVRSPSEFASGHVPGAINIPMEQIESRLEDIGSEPLLLICHAGQRATLAANRLKASKSEVCVVDGGTQAWKKAHYPVVCCVKSGWSLERQVRLGAGLMVVVGVALSTLVHPAWLGLSAFVGVGLTFAGLTDICPMGVLLAKMPWNMPRKPASVPQITDAQSGTR